MDIVDILIMAGQLILGLSILVGLHELGHLVAAKVFGMRVEQYSIGFPPKIFGVKYGETEYSVGAIPLGGYVKISGMVDESLDTDYQKSEPQPWEFRSKPAWQRLIVMMGGILVNVFTGILIFVILLYLNGESFLPAREVKYGVNPYELGKEIGLKAGDKIVEVNGKPYQYFSDLTNSDVLLGSGSYYTIERNSQRLNIPIPNDFIGKYAERKGEFIDPIQPFTVGDINKKYFADEAGLQTGDKIISVNGNRVNFFHEFRQRVCEYSGQEVSMVVERKNALDTLKLKLAVDEKTGMPVAGFAPVFPMKPVTVKYSLGQSLGKGTERAFGVIFDTIKGFGKIFRRDVSASESLSGPLGIAQNLYGRTWRWDRFWAVTGLLSMALAFMNFLPIPALDGGHVMFLLYEMIAGRTPSERFLELSQKIGMVLLFGLMIFAVFNDIIKNMNPKEKRSVCAMYEERPLPKVSKASAPVSVWLST